MGDLNKAIAYVEHTLTRGLGRKTAPARNKQKPPSYVWRAPVTDTQYSAGQIFKPKEKSMPQLIVTACTIKVTAALDAAGSRHCRRPRGNRVAS